MSTPPPVNYQGKVIAERDAFGYLVMFPDGSVEFIQSHKRVEAAAKEYARTHADKDAVNALVIEWR